MNKFSAHSAFLLYYILIHPIQPPFQKQTSHLLQSQPHASLHCAQWDIPTFRDFDMGQTPEIAPFDDLALLLWQLDQHVANERGALVVPHLVPHIWLSIGYLHLLLILHRLG